MDGDHERNWENQYEKHGSCATATRSLVGIKNFFETTIDMYASLGLDDALERTRFAAKNPPVLQRKEHFFDWIANMYSGAKPYIRCFDLPNNFSLIENIGFCYDKQLDLINCPQPPQCNLEFIIPTSRFQIEALSKFQPK